MTSAFVSVLFFMQLSFVNMQNTPDNPLKKYQWQKRVLLVFTPSATQPAGKLQLEKLRAVTSELADRDILLITVTGNQAAGGGLHINAAPALLQIYNVPTKDFGLILIGKDGGEKYRSSKVIDPETIFNLVDAMPMRQSEMNKQDRPLK